MFSNPTANQFVREQIGAEEQWDTKGFRHGDYQHKTLQWRKNIFLTLPFAMGSPQPKLLHSCCRCMVYEISIFGEIFSWPLMMECFRLMALPIKCWEMFLWILVKFLPVSPQRISASQLDLGDKMHRPYGKVYNWSVTWMWNYVAWWTAVVSKNCKNIPYKWLQAVTETHSY